MIIKNIFEVKNKDVNSSYKHLYEGSLKTGSLLCKLIDRKNLLIQYLLSVENYLSDDDKYLVNLLKDQINYLENQFHNEV